MSGSAVSLRTRIEERKAIVAVIGLGYVGLPLLRAVLSAGYSAIGFDIDRAKLAAIEAGRTYIAHLDASPVHAAVTNGSARVTDDYALLAEADIIVICVPTPLGPHQEPDLSYVEATGSGLARVLRPGQLVVLESTTYPGTTTDLLKPILQSGGLVAGRDFHLAFSPEREDPGNPLQAAEIPRVVGGDGPVAQELALAFYDSVVVSTVGVSSPATAEAVKLTENIFRAVNIALVNELKTVFAAMDIDIWEVIEAAKTKPFGFMPFYPGPGLGGHCIPIDPFYLTWKAREVEVQTRFIELAGEVNTSMPRYVVERLADALSRRQRKALAGARVLLVGVAYKANVDDTRESPAFRLWELLERQEAIVAYHDPHVPVLPATRHYPGLSGKQSTILSAKVLADFDAAIICTAHKTVDHALLASHCPLVVDTRNALGTSGSWPNVVKA
ncbi:UDP-N-acetyl-D-glucosamine dehydrogenase [Arboricoccus pini]|uniref:UDP-N-acetyl-D-glucosamine dehydrogenase n=1 Tax=Arboricoccus pini TaxID=1963835 RepID=A0A212RDK1_9PROT|nr:nucleotide sugar dehydrogenase [Arboricoccus pini]SNB70375.1 UDP-N-acetyl-D-glucosamine dehydrogenase [Arboricoccus pini]